jgi:hypothetical protein
MIDVVSFQWITVTHSLLMNLQRRTVDIIAVREVEQKVIEGRRLLEVVSNRIISLFRFHRHLSIYRMILTLGMNILEMEHKVSIV